ncbi:MAG: FAD-dependent oxidoreductase [Actinobacteria bacterium HGW-Actinobacteria-4]|nr:MAG: FAD-dependent oxidoreductase [Actinobacteria bacterium HGW-Actinobacteria-4]
MTTTVESHASEPRERDGVAQLRALGSTTVVVIGGGINGISTFRDLAMQKVNVVLVEREDFASGATSASSHMIHGGLRYLENGELRLVRESVHERNRLLKIAPHYVQPLRTTIPIFTTFSGLLTAPLRALRHSRGQRPKPRGAVLIKLGLALYDTFSRDNGSLPRHQFLRRDDSRKVLPALHPDVKYTATYYDAVVHSPERLALDVLLDGTSAHRGAHAVNYVEAIGLDDAGVRLRDRQTGAEFSLGARVVVNASGPWTDITNHTLGSPTAFMGGTKGSHVVIEHPGLLAATAGREIFFENADGRIVLIHPLHDRVLVGTTDIDADPAELAVCTPDEIAYFLELVAEVFPGIKVHRSDIVYHYSGIRPLPRHGDIAPGLVSRDYRIEVDRSRRDLPVVSLVGGKWTTFRALGETLANVVLGIIGRGRSGSTLNEAIGGGRDYPTTASDVAEWPRKHLPDLPPERREALFARYGTRAIEVARHMATQTDKPIADGALSTGELDYMVNTEYAVRLNDICLRRTNLAFTGRLTASHLDQIARALAAARGWDTARTRAETERATRELAHHHGWLSHAPSATTEARR